MSESVKFCKKAKRFLKLITAHPHAEVISEYEFSKFRQDHSMLNEIKEYEQNWQKTHLSVKIIIIFSLVTIIKCASFCIVTIADVDFDQPESNIKRVELLVRVTEYGSVKALNLSKFSCFLTNCTRFSNTENGLLYPGFRQFPHFPHCHPTLAWSGFYYPLDNIDIYTFFYSAINVLASLVDIIYIIGNIFLSSPNEILMFIVAPRLTLFLISKRIKSIYLNLFSSLRTFENIQEKHENSKFNPFQRNRMNDKFFIQDDTKQQPTQQSRFNLGHRKQNKNYLYHHDNYMMRKMNASEKKPETSSIKVSDRKLSLSKEELNDLVKDTLSMTRTEWFRQLSARKYKHALLIGSVIISIIIVAGSLAFQSKVLARSETISEFINYMNHSKCFIWSTSGREGVYSFDTLKVIDPNDDVLRWNLWNVVILFCSSSISAFIGAVCIANFYLLVGELNLHVTELEVNLTLLINMFQIANVGDSLSFSSSHEDEENDEIEKEESNREKSIQIQDAKSRSMIIIESSIGRRKKSVISCAMREIRNRFKEKALNNHFYGFLTLEKKDFFLPVNSRKSLSSYSDMDVKIASQKEALILFGNLGNEAYLDFTEKIYVNFRLFLDLTKEYGRVTTPIVLYLQGVTYAFAGLCFFFIRYVKDFTYESVIILSFLVLSVGSLMQAGAAFHSRAMKLIPLIYSVTAQTSRSKSIQIKHARLLWLRLEEVLDEESGIFLKALGFQLTYINIAKFTIGASTILLLALK